jgi:hypothetical protein
MVWEWKDGDAKVFAPFVTVMVFWVSAPMTAIRTPGLEANV